MFCRIIWVICSIIIVASCASTHTASYHYVQKKVDNNQVNFHNSLKIEEYINAFEQNWLEVPENKEIVIDVTHLENKIVRSGERDIVQIAVKTRKALEKEKREPIALSFVVDVSGSMGGEYIRDTKLALKDAIQELKTGDIVSITLFNYESRVISSNVVIDRESRAELVKKIDDIYAGGGTDIQAGLVAGYIEMSKFPKDVKKRLLLLTDGQSNVTYGTPNDLAKIAKVEYLEGARISTIGLGTGVNEGVLRSIAKNGSGHYYFADNSKTLTKILREDLGSTIVPVASDVKLTLKVGSGYRLVKIYGAELDKNLEGDSIVFSLGELNVDDWRIILVEIERVSESSASFDLTGHYFSIGSSRTLEIPKLKRDDNIQENTRRYALRNSVIFANASSLIEASKLHNAGNSDDAIRILDLQIANNQSLASINKFTELDEEIATLNKTRKIISDKSRATKSNPEISATAVSHQQEESSRANSQLISSLELVSDVLPGLWSTVAKLLIVAIK